MQDRSCVSEHCDCDIFFMSREHLWELVVHMYHMIVPTESNLLPILFTNNNNEERVFVMYDVSLVAGIVWLLLQE